jgi:hypothetical protein
MEIIQFGSSRACSTPRGSKEEKTSKMHKNLTILSELLPLFGCYQECCQWDGPIEPFDVLLGVGA